MESRVLAIIDIQNLFLSSREQFGPLARVDFVKLKDLFVSEHGEDVIVDKIAYVLSSPYHDGRDFSRFLKKQGYIVFNKMAQLTTSPHDDNIHTTRSRSWSDNMVWEAMKILPNYDEIFIVSGNGGFCSVVRAAKNDNKKVTVVSFRSSLQAQLASEADKVVYLDKEYLYDSSSFAKKREQQQQEIEKPTLLLD